MEQRHGKYIEKYQRDLRFSGKSELTIKNYSGQIWSFLNYFNAAQPKDISMDEIKDYLLTKININSRRHSHSSIKLFYKLTIKQKRKFDYVDYSKKVTVEPILLSQSEIKQMFDACENKKHLAILAILFFTGVRISELINLKITDFDKSEGVIYVRHGKGDKFRKVPYSPELREYLATYYRSQKLKPTVYIIEALKQGKRYSTGSVRSILKQLAEKSHIVKRVYPHLCRHQFLTALCEQKENLEVIKDIAGHKNSSTTSIYIHRSNKTIAGVKNPYSFV